MPKVIVNLEDEFEDNSFTESKIKKLSASLPSFSKAKSSSFKDVDFVQLSFTNVPKPTKDAFDKEAEKRGLGKKEFLYSLLRSVGIEVPDIEEVDGRRR